MKINREEFIQIIRENASGFDKNEIVGTDKLSDLGLDSLGFATTLFAIEDRFSVVVDEKYLSRLNSMSTVADLVGVFGEMGYHIELSDQ